MPADRTPVISVKKGIVYLPDEVRLKSPRPQGKAQMLAHEILKTEIVNDPEFGNCERQSQSTEVNLSNYGMPKLVSPDGSKALRD